MFSQFLIIAYLSIGNLCLSDNVPETNANLKADTIDPLRLDGRIVNGTKAVFGQFPHLVSLRRSYSDSHFCGGSIIADQWILTAGHCMFKENGDQIFPWSVTVVAGQIRLRPNHPLSQRRAVEAIIVHSAFDPNTLTNDIALLKLVTPLTVDTSYIQAVKLEKKHPEPGTMCQVAGWGYLSETKTIVSNNLMYVPLPLINPVRCRELLINVTHLPLGMFCAGYEEGLRDACKGDSGGGMTCGDTLSGVVSGGEGCARPTLPGVYTNVAYYRNWIENHMNNFNETDPSMIDWEETLGHIKHRTNSSINTHPNFFFHSIAMVLSLLIYLDVSFL